MVMYVIGCSNPQKCKWLVCDMKKTESKEEANVACAVVIIIIVVVTIIIGTSVLAIAQHQNNINSNDKVLHHQVRIQHLLQLQNLVIFNVQICRLHSQFGFGCHYGKQLPCLIMFYVICPSFVNGFLIYRFLRFPRIKYSRYI